MVQGSFFYLRDIAPWESENTLGLFPPPASWDLCYSGTYVLYMVYTVFWRVSILFTNTTSLSNNKALIDCNYLPIHFWQKCNNKRLLFIVTTYLFIHDRIATTRSFYFLYIIIHLSLRAMQQQEAFIFCILLSIYP